MRSNRLSLVARAAIIALGVAVFAPSLRANACPPVRTHPQSGAVYGAEYKLKAGSYAKAAAAAREAFPGLESSDFSKLKRPSGWYARRGYMLKARALKVIAAATIRGEGLTGGQYWRRPDLEKLRAKRIAWAIGKLRQVVKTNRYDYQAQSYLAEGLLRTKTPAAGYAMLVELNKRNRLYEAISLAALARQHDDRGLTAKRDAVNAKCMKRSYSQNCPVFSKGSF